MNLELSEDQEFFRETTRRFLETETPLPVVRALHETADGFERGWWTKAAELGWTSLLVPEAHGGGSLSGGPVADAAIVAEEMGRLVAPGPFLPVNVVAAGLGRDDAGDHGAVLTGLLAGELIASWAFAEANGAWNADGVGVTARADGSDVVLDGTKVHVEAAAEADLLLVTARTGDDLTQVLVPADAAGVTVRPGRSIDLVRRFASVDLDGVRVPATAVVGEVGGAADAVEHQLRVALALQCAEMVGLADRTYQFTVEYAQDRFAFGRPIASFQALKHRIADMQVWLQFSMATTDEAARAVDAGDAEAGRLVSVAKSYVGKRVVDIIHDCVQINGGIGLTWEHDIHLYLRRALVDQVVYGSPEQHRERLATLLEI